ncbi:MAG: exonuclease domain-containing protein [Rudaea sp.]
MAAAPQPSASPAAPADAGAADFRGGGDDVARRPASARRRIGWKLFIAVAVLFVAVVAIDAATVAVVGSRIPADLRAALSRSLDDSAGLLLVFAVFLLVVLGLLTGIGFRAYVEGLVRLRDGVRIMLAANAAHRLPDEGPAEAAELARVINALADRRQAALGEIERRVREASGSLEQEKNRLAALMSELTHSVLVCNAAGLILLYNAAARALFDHAAGSPASGIVGLGRSVFGVIGRDLIAHALDIVRERLAQGEAHPVSQFVTTTSEGRLLRAQMAPVLGAAEDGRDAPITGFVLMLDDVTHAVQGGEQRDRLVQSLAEDVRAGLGAIRAAVEAITGYEKMEPARRDQFTAIIHDEAVRLSERLDATLRTDAGQATGAWPLEEMQDGDLLLALERALLREGVQVTSEPGRDRQWLRVDSFAVVRAYSALAARLAREFGVRDFVLGLSPSGRFANLELAWRSARTDPAEIGAWAAHALDADRAPVSFAELARRHGGEQWCRAHGRSDLLVYCLQVPAVRAQEGPTPVSAEPRPVFYDFELFQRPGQSRELEERALADLVYTVFDTETTGLEPSAGDEIISISAVRIVNGRLRREEHFDQLVDAGRPPSPESVRIHGITASMLKGQPPIGEVLRRFARFAEETVLVGHNVAFDMRFLQLKEGPTGVRFTQPVLDTLLLSAVVHPDLREHELEANAGRLGVPIVGRHTSLGDAILTGEIFIKMIPLLAAQGIVTLKDALAASRRTYLARIRY